jgi:hypothetical protein
MSTGAVRVVVTESSAPSSRSDEDRLPLASRDALPRLALATGAGADDART